MKPIFFTGCSDVVVIGYNPENADYDNPRGEQYGFAPCVRAQDKEGNTRVSYLRAERCETEANAKAERMAAALTARLENLGKLPVDFESWVAGRPIYGSLAYQEYGAYDDFAWEREQA